MFIWRRISNDDIDFLNREALGSFWDFFNHEINCLRLIEEDVLQLIKQPKFVESRGARNDCNLEVKNDPINDEVMMFTWPLDYGSLKACPNTTNIGLTLCSKFTFHPCGNPLSIVNDKTVECYAQ